MTDVQELIARVERAVATADASALAKLFLIPELIAALREAEFQYSAGLGHLGDVMDERDELRSEVEALRHVIADGDFIEEAADRSTKLHIDYNMELKAERDRLAAELRHEKARADGYANWVDIFSSRLATAKSRLRNIVKTGKRLRAENEKLTSALLGFVEYFGAIERGEVGGSRPTIRTFEKVLLDFGRQSLPERPPTTSVRKPT